MVHLRSGNTFNVKEKAEVHVITGGGGYVGVRLGKALLQRGHKVILFDMQPPQDGINGMKFIQGDICNQQDVENTVQGADCVYHIASYGMSGREQLNRRKIEAVNIQGTNNVIKACVLHSIYRLVYTSTYNVVFGGQLIKNGDESLPYFPLHKHPDNYSPTKTVAEQAVLQANDGIVNDDGRLKTCALRLAGVYGPGERRHLPRIVTYIERGLFCFTYGAADNLVDFLHIDNLVQAHILAGEALCSTKKSVAAGQAYFISDGKPVNNFEFFRPLVEGLGYTHPTFRLPLGILYWIAFIIECLHFIIGRVYNFQPLLTRTEVYKTGVTHYFSIDKARKELKYNPVKQNDLTDVVQYFLKSGHGRKKKSFVMRMLVDICLALMFVMVLVSVLPTVK